MVLAGAPAGAQQPVKIRLAWVAPVSNWGSIWLEKKDLAKHLGKSYTVEPVRYKGTPPMVTALASGELEVANLAYSTLGIAITNAGLEDLRVIAHEFRDGVPGRYTHEYLVLADYRSYVESQDEVGRAFGDVRHWTRMSILNVARMGKFSSDRTIEEYCRDIWNVEPVPILNEQ